MNHIDIGGVTFEGLINEEYIKEIIKKAVSFLCLQFKCSPSYFDFHCIISLKYIEDINNYHMNIEDETDTSNAIFIPPFYQRTPQKKPIIIFNWKKIRKALESFITSVFVHEFVHYRDYLLCPKLENEFGKIFFVGVKEDSLQDRIAGTFCMRSEMRAKYFQEKYECSFCSTGEEILWRIERCATKVSSETDFYNVATLSGQFLCWKELCQQHKVLSKKVAELDKYLITLFDKNPPSDFRSVFLETDFLEKCYEFQKEFIK